MNKVKFYLFLILFISHCLPSFSQSSKEVSELVDSVMYNDSIAAYYWGKGNLRKAREYASRNVAINGLFGNKTVPYAISVLKLSKYISLDEENKYKSLAEEGLAILKDSLGIKSPIYTKYLLEYAWRQYNSNQIQEACNIIKDVAEGGFISEDPLMGYLYYSYAHFLRDNGEIDKAREYAKKAEAFYDNHKLWSEDYYALTLKDLALLSAPTSNDRYNYINKARKNIEQYKGKESIEYLNVTLDISYAYRAVNQLDKALEYAQFAKEIGERIKNLDYSSYLYTLEYLSNIYSNMEHYNEAIANAEECLTLMKERKELAIDERLPTLDSLVVYNWRISNTEKANLYAKEAYLIRKSSNASGEEMVRNLFYLLHSNYYLGKYGECEANVKEIKAIYGDTYSISYKHYYDDMQVLMYSYFNMKMYEKAIETSNEILNTYKKNYGEEDKYYAKILEKQALFFTYIDDWEKYHDLSLKALGIIRNKYGQKSPQYLSEQSKIANNFYNIGFVEESYAMFKDAAILAKSLYGCNNYYYFQNFFSALIIWQKYGGELFDDNKLEDLLRYIENQRVIGILNNEKDNDSWEISKSAYNVYIIASLPSLLRLCDKDKISLNSIYNCIMLLKSKQPDVDLIKSEIQKDLNVNTDFCFSEFLQTNGNYVNCLSADDPDVIDSLYRKSKQYIVELSNKSKKFKRFYKGVITSEEIQTNLRKDEVVIDYIPRKHLGDSCYVDFIVVLDKNRSFPNFIPVDNAPEQIRQICNSYKTSYFIIDNDSIISNLNIEVTKIKCIIGYELSIEHILNRDKKGLETSLVPVIQKENHQNAFTTAYDEFEKGVNLYKKKEYEEAIKFFFLSDSLMYVAKGEKSNYYGHGKQWIASCYHNLGNDSVAKKYSQYYYLPPIDMRQTVLSDSLLDIADSLIKTDKKEALEKYYEASQIEKSNLGKNSYWYANTISHCAEICNEIGDPEKGVVLEKEALGIREQSPGVDHIDYYWSLKNLYRSYNVLERLDEANIYGSILVDYMEKHKEILGSELLFYPIYNSALATINIENKQHQEAFSFIMKSIESAELLREFPPAYSNVYYKAIMGLGLIGKDSLSFELSKKIIPFYEKNTEKLLYPNEYFEILILAANHYYNQGDYITTSVYQERALDKIRDKDNLLYGMALSNLALTYSELGRIDSSIKLAEEAVGLVDSIQYVDDYAKRLLNLAHCYAVANRPKDALRCGKKCYNILNNKYGLDNHQTLVAANNLATYYNELGYREESGQLLFLIIEHAKGDPLTYGDILGTVYNNIAMNWFKENLDYQESLKYITLSYEIRKIVLGEYNLLTIQSLYNKGICLLDLEEFSESIECIKKAMGLTKNIIGGNNLRYIEMMKILPIIFGRAGNLDGAYEIAEERYELLKGIVDDKHLSILESLQDLSELCFFKNDTIKIYNTIIEEFNRYRRIITSDFPNYTSVERTNFVNRMGRFFDWLFPLVCYYKQKPEICSELYNALLLRKGILLNSEIEFGRLIRESGNPDLINNYNELIANKNLLNRQYQLPVEYRVLDVDSLRHAINEKEDYLVSASKEYGDYTKRFKTNWKDIRDQLKDGELSVEFVEFYDTCAIQNRIYYALVINKYSDSPELVPLCMEQEIHEVMKSDNPGGLYQLIWNPILQKYKNIIKLFFSPAGILNNIGIEYVDINENENISDKYAIYRLSSTREIVENEESTCKSAVLYGGLDYSVETDVLLAQNEKTGIENSSSVMYRGLSDSLSVRNSFEPLYNTKTEIKEIDKTLKRGNVSVSMFSDSFGTEESFKALSGKGMNLIHLATHGMYIGASEAESKKRESNLSFIQLDDSGGGQIQEDKSLSRSFLVMSGGDMLPSHKEVPDNLEDGILTASEISKLDLRGLDLVVLSACQTALGDVDNEGVYGLQRGFKKAGAKTMLMSLDKVDDEATRILMVEFYKNLIAGNSKYQSLKKAQQHLRKVDNGKYDKPEFWASFVMLDGLS